MLYSLPSFARMTLPGARGRAYPEGAQRPAAVRTTMILEHDERLPATHRLRTSREYDRVKSGGTAIRGRHCLVLVLGQPGELTKIGFIASKRGVGGSVQRNRAKRRLREIVRRRWPRIPRLGYWLVFVAARGTLTAEHQALATDVEQLLAKAGAIEPVTATKGTRPCAPSRFF